MNTRTLWVSAIGCGALAGCGVWFWLQGLETESRGDSEEVPVLVTARDIPRGTWLTTAHVNIRHVPKRYVEPSVLNAVTELTTDQGKPAYAAAVTLGRGEHLTLSKLVAIGKHRGLATLLPVGKIAVSLTLTPARGAGGWVRAGDHVDLFCTLDRDGGNPLESLAVPLIQDVPVLAVGDRLLGDPDEVKQSPSAEAPTLFTEAEQSVLLTVAVEPTEVGKLVLAREKGILSVGLRPIGETAILSPMPVQLSSLFLLPSTLPPLHETTHPRKGRSSLSRSQSGPSPLPGAVRSLERQLEQVLRQLP